VIALAAGCASFGYYAQAARGQLAVLAAARPIDDVLADPATNAALKERLQRAREIRQFAARELALPDNASYTAYADLGRPAVVWNVFATPALSLELKTWCYPLFGCAGYRGYFDKAAAERLGDELRAQGYDVNVAPVPAYSTLGWFSDPLLNTFINTQDGELARLVFHELAHQVVYVKDDTVFNESFATAVERAGVARWLASRGDDRLKRDYAGIEARRSDFLALLLKYRQRLQQVYAEGVPESARRDSKRAAFEALKADYRQMRASRWGGFSGYDRFFAQDLNNAHLAAVGAYYDLLPAFEALLARDGGALPAFYRDVRRLAGLDKMHRDNALAALISGETSR
jgi:predicted aminopeptidase